MICPKCQQENPEDNRFCRKCGSKLSLLCLECAAEILPDDSFCGKCGHDFQTHEGTPSIDYSEPQSYTPKHLADKILADRSAIEGERKLVTVLFADVANFTAISEKLDPEEVHQIMDGCFKILMDEIHQLEGTINQFTGDGVMALFGAPVAHEEHAQRACRAALSIQKAIEPYGEKIKQDCGVEFKMRVGLNSGHVIVGSIGDDLRMDYTAVGDTTNLASRMEGAAKPGCILVSKNTQRIARHYFEFDALDKLAVKGKEEPQEVFELIQASDVGTRFEASVAKGLTGFVGRKNSMAALMESYEKVQSGSGRIVAVVGEAGVGKSRLLLEFRNKLTPGGYAYLEGRCLQYGDSIIYKPILDIIKSSFEIEDGDREFIIRKKIKEKLTSLDEKLEHAIPSFQELLSLNADDEEYAKLEPQQKRVRTFEAIRDLLVRESGNKPLIIAIEDLHWIDRTSEEFLDYLIEWLANVPVMLILLYRTEYRHQWGSKTYYSKIGLDQLGLESSTELVKIMLEEGEIVPELRELILSRSAGNPLFMEEFTSTLLENGSIQKKENQYVLSREASEIEVPDTIQGIIAARMDRLEENLKRTMQVASVIGREFAFRILQTIIEMREDLKANLLNLQGLELIYEKNLFPELEYIFKHALTQEVAYNSLLQKRRNKIHENIGRAIEEIYAERLEEFYEMLAYHYSRSDNHGKAYHFLKLSGDKSANNYANWEAYNFYTEAIDTLKKMPESEENKRKQIDIRHLIGSLMVLLAYPQELFENLEEGVKLSKQLGNTRSLSQFNIWKAVYHQMTGELELGFKYAEETLKEAEKIKDIDLIVQSYIFFINAYSFTGQYFKLAEIAPGVIDLLEKNNKTKEKYNYPFIVYSAICAYFGQSLGALGDFDEAEIILEKGIHNAKEAGDIITIAFCELNYALVFFSKGDCTLTIEYSKKGLRHFEEVDWLTGIAFCKSYLGYGHYLNEDLETARQHAEQGLKIQINSGVEAGSGLLFGILGIIHCDSNNLTEALDHAEKAVELSNKYKEVGREGMSRLWLGKILGEIDPSNPDKGEDSIFKGIKILEESKLKAWVSQGFFYLGELYSNADQKEKALENLTKAETEFKDMGMDYWLDKTREVLARL